MKSDGTKLPTNKCSSYTPTPLMVTSSYLGVADSSKKWKIVISCYYGKLLYLELFPQNLYFFTPWEVLESEYLKNEKR